MPIQVGNQEKDFGLYGAWIALSEEGASRVQSGMWIYHPEYVIGVVKKCKEGNDKHWG